MEHTEFQFKTNINCAGCISKIKPALDEAEGINQWQVDTDNSDKILTIISSGITQENIISIIENKGFKIESI